MADDHKEVQAIITSCRDCIFAEYDGPQQTGCEFDRLHSFHENGAVITQAEHEGKTHFLVVGRFCNACRNHDWGRRHPQHKWHEVVESEFAVQVAIIVYVDGTHSLIDVERTLDSIVRQRHNAHGLFVVLNNATLETRTYVNLVRSMQPPMKWEVREIKPLDDGTFPDRGRAVDEAVQYVQSTFYSLCNAGYAYAENFLSTIENAINNYMMRFVVVLPDDEGNALVVQTGLHKYVKGNTQIPVTEKLHEIAGEENTEHMIKRFEELPLCHA